MHEKIYSTLRKSFAAFLLLFTAAHAARAQYCTTGLYITGCTDDDYIQSFSTTLGTTNITNNNTGCSNTTTAYTYYPSQTLTAAVGTTCSLSITITPDFAETVYIWVDWNADFDFIDAGEFIATGALPAGQSGTATLTIPTGIASGTKRMRVRCVYAGTSAVTACSNEDYGEVEDYNVVVTGGAAPCSAPGNLTTSNVTANSATFNWLATPGALGYEYVLDNSPTDPTSGFQVASTTTVTLSGINPGTMYYFHLRAICSNGVPTSWIAVSFTTPSAAPCVAPASVTVTSTSNSATLTWPPVTDATGYEYANTSGATPPASGVPTTGLTASYSSLAAGTTYYAHVRSSCGGSFSPWQTTLYNTSPTSVNNVSAGLSIYATPNPTSDKLMVRLEGSSASQQATLTLTDLAGRVLRRVPVTGAETELNLTGVPAGFYLLQYMGAERTGVIRVQKL